jgi:hypothetical protein
MPGGRGMSEPTVSVSPSDARTPPDEHPKNTVMLALLAALLELEQRRDRGKVRRRMDRRPAA